MVEEADVREKLRNVVDPELNVNIVDLGLVYEIKIEGDTADILMTLTTPGCPLHSMFDELVREEVLKLDEIERVDLELTFEPRWTPEKMSEEAKEKVGNIPGRNVF